MKRYCQTLTLVDDEEMIEKYCEVHAHVWPEVIAGQHQVGILSMQIYRQGRQLFMITDTADDFDFERDMARLRGVRRCLPQCAGVRDWVRGVSGGCLVGDAGPAGP